MGEEPKKSSNLKCCIGIIIIFIIAAIGFMMLQDNPDHSTNFKIGDKSFKINNLTNKQIKNIEGNNTNSIDIPPADENINDGFQIIKTTKDDKNCPLNNEALMSTATEQQHNGVTYKIKYHNDGTNTAEWIVFETKDGSVYQIWYDSKFSYFDYWSFGDQMNK